MKCLPRIFLDAVYRRRSGGIVIHNDRLASVGRIGGPVLRRAILISVGGGCVKNIVVSLVSHGTTLAGCPLQASHT